MFFAAEKELNARKRRKDMNDGITVEPGMVIHVGLSPSSKRPGIESLDVVYPAFSGVSMKEIIQIADPGFNEEHRPTKRQKASGPIPALSGDISVPQSPASVQMSPKSKKHYNSLDDLIRTFPALEKLIADQQMKLDTNRVPVEFVRPFKKPAPVPTASARLPSAIFESKPTDDTSGHSMSTSTPPDLTTGAPTPAEPGQAAGLLAGIDDLFGESKKSKLKSKYRR